MFVRFYKYRYSACTIYFIANSKITLQLSESILGVTRFSNGRGSIVIVVELSYSNELLYDLCNY